MIEFTLKLGIFGLFLLGVAYIAVNMIGTISGLMIR